jgi:hypothetical protein
MSTESLSLSSSDRILVRGLIASRTRMTILLTAVAGALLSGLLTRLVLGGVAASTSLGVLLIVAGVGAGAAWRLGWQPLLAMREDLTAGKKIVGRGQVRGIPARFGGGLPTHVHLHGMSCPATPDQLAGARIGDEVEVEVLPGSGAVIVAERIVDQPTDELPTHAIDGPV